MKGSWFDVDKAGLAKQLADMPTWKLVAELLQNAWDEASSQVTLSLVYQGRGISTVSVEDDNPTGFADLTHAWTLFAPSMKAGDESKRGRFNMGEKMLLAVAQQARIETTTGTVYFDHRGRTRTRTKRAAGSKVVVELKLSERDLAVTLVHLKQLVPNVATTINGIRMSDPVECGKFTGVLPTVSTDAEGNFVRRHRHTVIRAYRLTPERPNAMIYELGIPVVESDFPWHLDVQQKVPLNRDRDNVHPSFLQALRVLAFNAMNLDLTDEQFSEDWAREAAGDERASHAAVQSSLNARFGTKRVAFDPSDLEANRLATAAGYTVVHGGSLSKGEWANARETTQPAGKVTPSPKPFVEGGRQLKMFEGDTGPMLPVMYLAATLSRRLFGRSCDVLLADDPGWGFRAVFGPTFQLYLNVAALGDTFWTKDGLKDCLDLLIHEFAHHDGSNHLEERYWRNLSDIGARIACWALIEPAIFRRD